MAYSWPIWNDVNACKYNSNKSFGFRDTGEVNLYVGSSANNSHHMLTHVITRRMTTFKGERVWVFTFSVDNVILKKSYFKDNNGRAGEHICDKTKLNRIKSLK